MESKKQIVTRSTPDTGWECPKNVSGFPTCRTDHGKEKETHPGDMPEVRRRHDTNFTANILPANKGELNLTVKSRTVAVKTTYMGIYLACAHFEIKSLEFFNARY